MKKFLTLFLAVLPVSFLLSQVNIDSLKNVLSKEKSDSATLNSYLKKAYMMGSDKKEAQLVIAGWVTGQSQKNNLKYIEATAAYLTGLIHQDDNNFSEATEYFTQALSKAEECGNYKTAILSIDAIATMYKTNHQYGKAIAYYKKAIEMSEKHDYIQGLGLDYYNLGATLHDSVSKNNRDNTKVFDYFRKAIVFTESIKDTDLVIQITSAIASVYSESKKNDTAMMLLNKSYDLIKASGQFEYYTLYYLYLGLTYTNEKKYVQSIEALNTGLQYAVKYNKTFYEYNYYAALAEVYDSLKEYKKAYQYRTAYVNLHDSATDKEKFAAATNIENKYQNVKKENEIIKLNKDKEIASAKRKELTKFLTASLIGLTVFIILSFFLLKNIRARKKAYAELEKRNKEIKEQALLLSRQARLIAKFQSQMNPHFTFNALHNIYGLVIGNENEKAVTQIQSLAQLMRKTLTNSIKEEITLEEEIDYLQKYIDFEQATAPAKFNFTINVDKELENALIPPMMIQPFIENAVKHGELDKVSNPFIKVLVQKEKNLMKLIIEDNGKGLNKENININKLSHSISIIKSRIELLFQGKNIAETDGLLIIKSFPETTAGTTIKFYLPLAYAY